VSLEVGNANGYSHVQETKQKTQKQKETKPNTPTKPTSIRFKTNFIQEINTMPVSVIRCNRPGLRKSVSEFTQSADSISRTIQALNTQICVLRDGKTWVGTSADAFYKEMETVIRQLQNLQSSHQIGAAVTRDIIRTMDAAQRESGMLLQAHIQAY
jgi:uncharacterized protein YukE